MGRDEMNHASINQTFARIMRILTWAGLILLVLFGVLYLSGIYATYDTALIMQHWDKPASQFWLEVGGEEAHGYCWFLSFLPSMDSLAMTGIMLLALTPLITLLFVVWKMKGLYLILLVVLIVEFLFSVLWPLL